MAQWRRSLGEKNCGCIPARQSSKEFCQRCRINRGRALLGCARFPYRRLLSSLMHSPPMSHAPSAARRLSAGQLCGRFSNGRI